MAIAASRMRCHHQQVPGDQLDERAASAEHRVMMWAQRGSLRPPRASRDQVTPAGIQRSEQRQTLTRPRRPPSRGTELDTAQQQLLGRVETTLPAECVPQRGKGLGESPLISRPLRLNQLLSGGLLRAAQIPAPTADLGQLDRGRPARTLTADPPAQRKNLAALPFAGIKITRAAGEQACEP